MAIDSSVHEVRDFCSLLVLTDEHMGTLGTVQGEPQLALSTYLAFHGSQMHSDSPVTGQNAPDLCRQTASTYSSSAVNVDIEKGNVDKVIVNDETDGSVKTEIAFTKALRRQNSLLPAGEPIQPFMDHILMLLKLDSKAMERAHDAPNNKWRKYKRPALFNSRQIVLLFSILSSMGTILLICLTLRVRLADESLVLT